MGYPLNNGSDGIQNYTFYQGVIASQIVCMFVLFFTVQSIHYFIWGYQQEAWQKKKDEQGSEAVEPLPPSQWKWDQKSFNLYFAIIVGHHLCSLLLPLAYYPSIATCVGAYIHFGGFCGLLINTICVDEKDPGKGGRTLGNRIFWIIMCICNLFLIAAGAYGISNVLT